MDEEKVLYRILSGYYYIVIDNTRLRVNVPTLSLRQQAHSLYISILEDNKYNTDDWISDSVINNLSRIYNIWNDKREKELKNLISKLEEIKIDLYLNFIDTKIRDRDRTLIKQLTKTINSLYKDKTYFDDLKLESYCQGLKNQYLIVNSIYDENNNKFFQDIDFNDIDSRLLEQILLEIYSNMLSIDDLKTFAKTEVWRSYWDTKKENIFNRDVMELTDDQRLLINISKTFDAIREHFEAPSAEVFNDNDALEGWILHQSKSKEKEKQAVEVENRVGKGIKDKGHSNVFIMTRDPEEQEKIYGLNDKATNYQINNMIRTVQEKGAMETKDFSVFRQQHKTKKEQN